MNRFNLCLFAGMCVLTMLFCGRAEPVENLFPYDFEELDDEGMPAGWKIVKTGENAGDAVVSSIRGEDGEVIMKVELPLEASVYLDPERSFEIDPACDYVAVVRLKAENIGHEGHWYADRRGIRIVLMARDGGRMSAHGWLMVHGEGSTDGWVTGFLPFPTGDEEKRQNFSRINILLRCLGMWGTVYFKRPVIVRLPGGVDINRSFELEDGTRVEQSWLRLVR